MPDPFKQAARLGQLSTVLGEDVLVLLRFMGADRMSGLFEYQVDALSAKTNINFDALIGTSATIKFATRNHDDRFFNGIVTQAKWAGTGENGNRYTIVLRPWFWLAGRRRNQRIFHDKTIPDILTELLGPYSSLGKPAMKQRLTRTYAAQEYTVQYRESDLDFACRLMERAGINYHFVHTDGNHTLTLTDSVEEHDYLPGEEREYKGIDGDYQEDEEHFWEWFPERNLTTGAVRLTDYNFKSPTAVMEVDRIGDAAYAEGTIEAYDYPGDYLEQGEGKGVVALRTMQERAQDRRHRALGNCVTLDSGQKVKLTGDQVPGLKNETYLCLIAQHSYVSDSYGSGGVGSDGYAFTASYVLTNATAPIVPEMKTPTPLIYGPQTAVVVGEGEIDCDEFGRILVRFHWDLNAEISMRCRVSQNWASSGWGGMIIPRIGMEVVVEFLEGDPDKPLVTGCVYNGRNMPPYSLPGDKTKSVFKTNTHQGSGFNELTFEDEKDRELIYVHGQKDHQIEILNDRAKTIGRDQTEAIGRDKSITVGQDHTESVARDASHTIGNNVTYTVGQNQIEKYGKDHIHRVGNIHKQDIVADHLVQVGRNVEETVKGRYTLNVNQSITNNTKTHTLMAFEKFVIKGPGGKITIDSSGITLEAPKIELKGMVKMGGMGMAQVPALQGAANDALPLVEECPAKTDA